ncbi:sulfotransferase family protein [Marinobacter sp. DUT-1]|uniref:sulfotransferase family protein n=1 Tax=Marinobacter sp. DUT-1 TaxID=3412037 RepID=UPI003D186177
MAFFFLMCSERSGSNLISKLMNGHENICGPSTKHIINPVARNLFRYGDLSDTENWKTLLSDIERLLSVEFSFWKRNFSFEDLENISPVGDIKSLIQNIFLEEARANGKQHLFVKENHVYEFLPFLMTNFPEAKFVYQVRDPRDMALSWKKNSDHPGGAVQAAHQWKKDQQQSLKNHHLLATMGKSHFVRYEDLTSNSEHEVKRILDFLGVPFDQKIFEFHKDEITRKNARMQKAWGNLEQGVISNNSQKYKSELASDEILAIESICRFEMKHLGYELENSFSALESVSKEWLEELQERELREVILDRSDGVKENMAAKTVFYQR